MSLPAAALCEEIVRIGQSLDAAGLVPNKSGNVSCRDGAGFLITPAGIPYRELTADTVVYVPLRGEPGHGTGVRPSSEWRMHATIYAARSDVGAIVHTHSPKATALACAGLGIPPFHYMIAMGGGHDIRCAPYATFGSEELAAAIGPAIAGRNACLLANHGLLACGATLDDALALAVEVEALARMYWQALQLGEPVLLPRAEMDRVLEKFRGYGR